MKQVVDEDWEDWEDWEDLGPDNVDWDAIPKRLLNAEEAEVDEEELAALAKLFGRPVGE